MLWPAAASAQGFTELGDELRVDKDTVFSVAGYLRMRAELLHNLDLDRGVDSRGELFFPVPVGEPEAGVLTHADMRLRTDVSMLAPTLGVGVKVRLDIFDNLALGSTPRGTPQGSTTQEALAGAILVKRVYGELLTPLGLLLAGRMGSHWGLGVVANSGDCDECDSGDAADRIAFITPLLGHIWALAYDFSAIGPTTRRTDEARTIDLDPSDDVRTVTFALLAWESDLVRARRLGAGRTTFEYGAYVSHRWQDEDIPASYLQAAVEPDTFGPQDVVQRDFRATAMDVWLRLTHPWVRAELEAAVVLGRVGQTSPVAGVRLSQELTTTAWGGALVTSIGPWDGPVTGGVDVGVASGDDAPGFGTSLELDASAPPPGALDGPQARLPTDTTVDNFRFHPDYRVDRILFRELIGTVTDAVYVRPHLEWRIAELGPYALRASLFAVASWALEPDSAPGGEQPLGVELDPTLEYGTSDGFAAALDYAVLFPLAGLANPALDLEAQPAQLLRLRMMFRF